MKTINFTYIYDYMRNAIQNIVNDLYDQGQIKEKLVFLFFNNSGEYFKYCNQEKYETDLIDRTVLVNILNNGGIQDSTVSIDTYLQIVGFEILALDEQREDIEIIFTKFAADYKSHVDNIKFKEQIFDINGELITEEEHVAAVQITTNNFPTYQPKIDNHGIEKFVTNLSTNVIVFKNAQLSNSYKLYINNTQIPFLNVILSRNCDNTADLQKRTSVKFYQNTTGFQIQISGLYIDNDVINDLLDDCANNTKFGQPYSVQLIKPNGVSLLNDNFFCMNSRFDLKFGSIISYNATFFLASEL